MPAASASATKFALYRNATSPAHPYPPKTNGSPAPFVCTKLFCVYVDGTVGLPRLIDRSLERTVP